jgi:hypothetical protein
MRKVLLGVAMAAVLALATTGQPVQSTIEQSFTQQAPAPEITLAVDHSRTAIESSAFASHAVWHGTRQEEGFLLAAEKKRPPATGSGDSKRGSAGSGGKVSYAPEHTLRL